MDMTKGPLASFFGSISKAIDDSTTFVRDKVTPHQKYYPWYHQKFRRVPTIDECYSNDMVCMTEANYQFQRDKMVDDAILVILRDRMLQCSVHYGADDKEKYCAGVIEDYKEAAANWFSRYGDLPVGPNCKVALMKQKHRMIWERRHGKIGSGAKYEQ